MEYLNINTSSDYYLVATIELDYEEKFHWDDEDKQLWKFAVTNISNEILKEQFVFDTCCDINDRVCIIIGRNGLLDNNDFNLLLENRLELIRAFVNKHLSFTITIGVGSTKNELFDITASYKESIIALKNKLTIGKNKVIIYDSVSEPGIKGSIFTVEHRSRLLLNMRTANDIEVKNLIAGIFEKMRRENIHYELLFVACTEMISVCLEFIVEVGLSFKEVLPDSKLNIIEEIQSKRSIDEMEDWIEEIYRHTLDCVQRIKSSKPSKLIEEVKRFIHDNYQNNELSIDEIAKNLFINYAHLCYIFKRDAGTTINEYLTEFRIKKAKELLDSGNSLVLHVANRVGYADANYFGKCFKKYYGLAPSKYLENIRR
ncbi:MAG TPA: AraC family transcriptional regulator [Clostridia bacterium]|nr:AraC family transcriptional regulator [Clostridia bacterium]